MKKEPELVCTLEDYRLIRETKEYRHTPFGFREHICKDKKLTQTAKLAWIVLSDYSVFSPDFKIHMSLRTLGNKIGKDKRTAKRALEELEHHGYIQTNLQDPKNGIESTVIWVRFPEEAVQAIIQKPDRKTQRTEHRALSIVNPIHPKIQVSIPLVEKEAADTPLPSIIPTENKSDLMDSIVSTKDTVSISSGAPALPGGAFLSGRVALAPPFNTNNNTKPITKITNNKASADTPHKLSSITRLLELECLFLKFVERANVLKAEGLEGSELQTKLWEPYLNPEKNLIQRFESIHLGLSQKPWNVREALQVNDQYNEVFREARVNGLSPLQATTFANNAFENSKIELKNTLQWAMVQLADILTPPKKPESKAVVMNLSNPKRLPITKLQVHRIASRLQRAFEGNELKAIQEPELETLVSQLIYHAEHWAPKVIHFKNEEERINIAVNVALKRMKVGNWSAPYGWVKQNILQREQEAKVYAGALC